MSAVEATALSALIFAAAVLYSCVGHAGASAYLAVMGLMAVDPTVMKPTALVLNILVAIIGTVRFYRAGCFSWRVFWPFAATSVPAALVGGFWDLPSPVYKQVVGVVLLFAAVRSLFFRSAIGTEPLRTAPVPVALGFGGVIGLLSGLTGIGGGIFLSPLLLLTGWADMRHVAGVSAAFILVNSLAGLTGHLAKVHQLPLTIVPWAVAAIAGGVLGSWIGSRRLADQNLRRVLGAVLAIAALKLVFV